MGLLIAKCGLVFSAHAEVVPGQKKFGDACKSILRARGGSSKQLKQVVGALKYSPRTRR